MKSFELINQDIEPFIKSTFPETKNFLFSGLYTKRKFRMKHGLQVTAFDKDIILSDFIVTLSNGSKTFFQINANLIKHHYKKLTKLPLTAAGRFKNHIFFKTNNMLYLTHRYLAFRNLNFRMSNNQYYFINFSAYPRPLNKMLFFNILSKLTSFDFKNPSLLSFIKRNYKRLRIFYLGLRLKSRRKFYIKLWPRKKRFQRLPCLRYRKQCRSLRINNFRSIYRAKIKTLTSKLFKVKKIKKLQKIKFNKRLKKRLRKNKRQRLFKKYHLFFKKIIKTNIERSMIQKKLSFKKKVLKKKN